MANSEKRNKKNPLRFDKEGFYLSLGIGLGSLFFGIFLMWGILTAPEGESTSTGFTLAQRIARTLPHSTQEKIALVLSLLFILFGIILILTGFVNAIKFLIQKIKGL